MRGGIRQDAEKKRRGASTIRRKRKRRREGESGVVWTSGERDLASGRKERCDASQDAQDAWDAEYPALASGRNAGGSDARSVFADGYLETKSSPELPFSQIGNSTHLVVYSLALGFLRLDPPLVRLRALSTMLG